MIVRKEIEKMSIVADTVVDNDTGMDIEVVVRNDYVGTFPSIEELLLMRKRIDNTIGMLKTHYNGDNNVVNLELAEALSKASSESVEDSKSARRNRAGDNTFIYMMKSNLTGFIKIGKSKKPKARERTLQSEDPLLEMIFTSPLVDSVEEFELHQMFSDKRVRGEWFNLTNEDVIFIKKYFEA